MININKEKINDYLRILNSKVEKSELQEVADYTTQLCKYSDLKELYNKVMPSLKSFEDNVISLNRDMDQHHEIIRRYDEVISDKASKIAIKEIYGHFNKYLSMTEYCQLSSSFESEFSHIKSTVESFQDSLQKMNEVVEMEIKSSVRK